MAFILITLVALFIFSKERIILRISTVFLVLVGIVYSNYNFAIHDFLMCLYVIPMFYLINLFNSASMEDVQNIRIQIFKYLKFFLFSDNKRASSMAEVIIEEYIFRGVVSIIIAEIATHDYVSVLVGTILFYFIHQRNKRKWILLPEIEFFLFCFLLQYLYVIKELSILILIFIHFNRNYYIDFLENSNVS